MSDTAVVVTSPMVPSPRELKKRNNVFVQTGRFVVLNLKMVQMIMKGDH